VANNKDSCEIKYIRNIHDLYDYSINNKIGEGAYGSVYLATSFNGEDLI